jgi:hypothetical protein
MVLLSGLTFDLADIVEVVRDSVRVFAATLYEIGAGPNEIRRVLIGRDLYAETL